MVESKDTVIKRIKELVKLLETNFIHIDQAILFGSYAKGNARSDSDIDVVLVSADFEGIRFADKQRLNPFIYKIDPRLEVHPYKADEFNENDHWFVREIERTGQKVPLAR
jgi:predicted nucleotidyltransferase